MTEALLPNLGFEYELTNATLPRAVRRQSQRWSHILRLIPGFAAGEPFAQGDATVTRVVAWGCSSSARDLVGPRLSEHWPVLDAVCEANDKRTSHRIERSFEIGLPGAIIAESLGEIEAHVASLGGSCLVKHPFGVSGRRRVLLDAADPNPQARRAIANLLTDVSSVVVEPLVQIERELSVHFDITSAGAVDFVGCSGLLADASGVFRGNTAPLIEVPDHFVSSARDAAVEIAKLGYHGPLGIDGFVGTLGEDRVMRPVSEINARWTFGRLALLLAEHVGSPVAWGHPIGTEVLDFGLSMSEIRPLPAMLDPDHRSGTWYAALEHARFMV